MKKWIAIILAGIMVFSLAACSGSSGSTDEAAAGPAKVDNSKWLYNADDDVYYQIGISYCENPSDESYENLAIFVPGAYMDANDNGDGTYTCELNDTEEINGYTAATAPIVMPINTPGYSAQNALTDYADVSEYMEAGFIYVHAGCRGRDEGAPAGVTDLKAAVRYIRYCDDELAGDAESIFTFGMSGGGAQSAIMGSTGDSELYDAYLEEIGAVMSTSDAVLGSMCWCPITNLDTADEAYEWMMGSTRSGLSLTGTYETAQDYIDALNANGEWVTYDADTNTATITSIADYVSALKNASKNLGAFDQLDAGQGENTLFGYGDGSGAHFNQTLADILSELGSEYASGYAEDLEKTDSAGNTAAARLDMYTPLYYLLESEDGYNTSYIAKYWRIRTGINQSDCALSTEMDLALALENCDQVSDVDFETVWGQGHTMAERTGSSTNNFITWVNTCMGSL